MDAQRRHLPLGRLKAGARGAVHSKAPPSGIPTITGGLALPVARASPPQPLLVDQCCPQSKPTMAREPCLLTRGWRRGRRSQQLHWPHPTSSGNSGREGGMEGSKWARNVKYVILATNGFFKMVFTIFTDSFYLRNWSFTVIM